MKSQFLSALTLITALTGAYPVWAQEAATSSMPIEEAKPQRLRDLGLAVNPQLGVASFEFSGRQSGASETNLGGGATFEFGGEQRKMETGLLVFSAGREIGGETVNSTLLAIPMMAKLRMVRLRAQSWYAKLGFMPTFELNSNKDGAANNIDVMSAIGLGGRFGFSRTADLIVEATYNRGLLDALPQAGATYNQGVLIFAGLSFRI